MARKQNKALIPLDEVAEGIILSVKNNVEALLRGHFREIDKVRDESDTKKVNVAFGILIDGSESVPKILTRIRFAQTVTDERVDTLEDPKQPRMFDKEAWENTKRQRDGKAAASGEKDDDSGE
ncbi:MAG: hypothetical protein KC729_21235 [Candidatus Eisenbacteria bacterium]|uniref:Uncharacterized protein n=1 Tax=Eiseniibacteriota bacterium TaxID=2212470 RepID=A0A956M512_UNCEI|nr:hypothetical protein [Candidatus Eisenbacteria bacterium]